MESYHFLLELALIVANKGIASGLMKASFFGPVVIVVIATTVLTPILLKVVYRRKDAPEAPTENKLVERYEDASSFDRISMELLEAREQAKTDAKADSKD